MFQETAEIYLVFFICYLILFPLQIHAVLRQRHIVPRLFTASMALELGAVLANVIHIFSFAKDGEGYPKLAVFGDVLDILARVSLAKKLWFGRYFKSNILFCFLRRFSC